MGPESTKIEEIIFRDWNFSMRPALDLPPVHWKWERSPGEEMALDKAAVPDKREITVTSDTVKRSA